MTKQRVSLIAAMLALVLAQSAQAQAPGIEIRVSGQINRAILNANDGVNNEWFNVDNGNSTTRFRFTGDSEIMPGVKAGVLFEAEFPSNSSGAVSMAARSVAPVFTERHMDLYFSGRYGMLRMGQGDGAANGAAEVDLSGTTVVHYSSMTDVGSAFLFNAAPGTPTAITLGSVISNQDFESRYDRVLYRTPEFSGFTAEASWGNKATDVIEAAVRYGGKFSFGQIAAALGYSREDGAPGGSDDKTTGGSVSWLHGSGFNLTYTHTMRDIPGTTGKFDYVKVGYKFGQHAVSVDYGQGKDQALTGDKATGMGIGYVWSPVGWAEVFGLAKQHSLDRPGASLLDMTFFMVGSRVKF